MPQVSLFNTTTIRDNNMRNCEKCLENNWQYEFIDGWIRATCQICFNQVEFPSKKLKKKLAAYENN